MFLLDLYPLGPVFQMPSTAPPPDELSDPNLTPLPTRPGIKYIASSPCCDLPSSKRSFCYKHMRLAACQTVATLLATALLRTWSILFRQVPKRSTK